MNVSRPDPTSLPTTVPTTVLPFTSGSRLAPREREFGTGYGKSSGYAATRRYTTLSSAPRYFRFA